MGTSLYARLHVSVQLLGPAHCMIWSVLVSSADNADPEFRCVVKSVHSFGVLKRVHWPSFDMHSTTPLELTRNGMLSTQYHLGLYAPLVVQLYCSFCNGVQLNPSMWGAEEAEVDPMRVKTNIAKNRIAMMGNLFILQTVNILGGGA